MDSGPMSSVTLTTTTPSWRPFTCNGVQSIAQNSIITLIASRAFIAR